MTLKLLTARQLAVLQLVAIGCSNKEIGTRLEISVAGVKKHLEALGRRYHVSSRTALVHAAIAAGDLSVQVRRRTSPAGKDSSEASVPVDIKDRGLIGN